MQNFVDAMRYIRAHHGELPPSLSSIQTKFDLGDSGVPEEVIQIMRDRIIQQNLVERGESEIVLCLVDGFLLYPDPTVVSALDIKLLVRAPHEKLQARREARNGYVTLEGSIIPLEFED
jgi:nicotinamide/nicotinate riboside kinase